MSYYKYMAKVRVAIISKIKLSGEDVKFHKLYFDISCEYGVHKKFVKEVLDDLKANGKIIFDLETYDNINWAE